MWGSRGALSDIEATKVNKNLLEIQIQIKFL
jgi:hypothetical protein